MGKLIIIDRPRKRGACFVQLETVKQKKKLRIIYSEVVLPNSLE